MCIRDSLCRSKLGVGAFAAELQRDHGRGADRWPRVGDTFAKKPGMRQLVAAVWLCKFHLRLAFHRQNTRLVAYLGGIHGRAGYLSFP